MECVDGSQYPSQARPGLRSDAAAPGRLRLTTGGGFCFAPPL